MIARSWCVALLACAPLVPGVAQPRTRVDSLVSRITRHWGTPPRGGWCAEWLVVRGDSTALHVSTAEITGSDRAGVYTVIVRPSPFAAPTLVGRLRIGHERAETVTAHAVRRGDVLTDADLLVRHSLVWGAPTGESALNISTLLGTESRRALRDGEAIRLSDVAATPVVLAGDTVTAEIVRDGVRLALVGTALHNAPLGARVFIRLNRGRRFAGIATGHNTVRLD